MQHSRFIARILGAGLLIGGLPLAHALERGTTESGLSYVSGGVGADEKDLFNQEKRQHNLWLTTAVRGSGAYLAAVQVRILDRRTQKLVLEHTLDGPWLLATLPAGRYLIEATYSPSADATAQVLKRSLTIEPHHQRQLILYFNSRDQVGTN